MDIKGKTVGEILEKRTHKAKYQNVISVKISDKLLADKVEGVIADIMRHDWVVGIEPYSVGHCGGTNSVKRSLHLRIETSSSDVEHMSSVLRSYIEIHDIQPRTQLVPVDGVEALDLCQSYNKTFKTVDPSP